MKKIFTLLFLLAFALGAYAQKDTIPRFGSNQGQVYTSAGVTFEYYNYSTQPAPVAITPNASQTPVRINNVTGNLTINLTNTSSRLGDQVVICFNSDSISHTISGSGIDFSSYFSSGTFRCKYFCGTFIFAVTTTGARMFVGDGTGRNISSGGGFDSTACHGNTKTDSVSAFRCGSDLYLNIGHTSRADTIINTISKINAPGIGLILNSTGTSFTIQLQSNTVPKWDFGLFTNNNFFLFSDVSNITDFVDVTNGNVGLNSINTNTLTLTDNRDGVGGIRATNLSAGTSAQEVIQFSNSNGTSLAHFGLTSPNFFGAGIGFPVFKGNQVVLESEFALGIIISADSGDMHFATNTENLKADSSIKFTITQSGNFIFYNISDTATLASGIDTVFSSLITDSSMIFLQPTGTNGSTAIGNLRPLIVSAGNYFVVKSLRDATVAVETNDNSHYNWWFIERRRRMNH